MPRRENRQDWTRNIPETRIEGPYEDFGWERRQSVLPRFRDPSVRERGRPATRYRYEVPGAAGRYYGRQRVRTPDRTYLEGLRDEYGQPEERGYRYDPDRYYYGRHSLSPDWQDRLDEGRDDETQPSSRRYGPKDEPAPLRRGYSIDERGWESYYGEPTRRRRHDWAVPGPYVGVGPQGYQRSSEQIEEEICARLTQHGLIDASDIEVEVENREVTLTGTVDSWRTKRMAEDVAETVPGLHDIHNRLKIRR